METEQSEESEGEMSATADTAALQSAAKAPKKEKSRDFLEQYL